MSKKISFCALMSVLGVLSMFLSAVLPSNTIFFFLFSTLFTYICTAEYGKKYGFLTFAVITLVSYFIYPNKITVGIYAVAVGYYPVIKQIIEHLDISLILKYVLKLVFALVAFTAVYIIFKQFLIINISVYFIGAIGFVIMLLYDIALNVGIRFYALKLRRFK